MATTKHTATIDGQTFTRNSQNRVYTHCVVAKPSYEAALRAADAWAPQHGSNFAYYTEELADGCTGHVYRYHAESEESYAARAAAQSAERKAHYTEELGGDTNRAAYIARKIAEEKAAIEKMRAEGYYDRWDVVGWCGRLDLAQKLASSKLCNSYWATTAVVEATHN